MIVRQHLVDMWNASVHNEPFEWSDETPTQPRTEAGIILFSTSVFSILLIFSEFALTSIIAILVAAFPAVLGLIGVGLMIL